ncbi:Cupredoxin [Gigaspora margarita]|uniref:Cupredoxin n=1 Tax=Gigaspora margarita TaxID=4874 RepID=A0A8H4AZK6_GIGMA|nr:Cupredoxin [Gigaspora margarita]
MFRTLDILVLLILTFLACSNAEIITVKVADSGLDFNPQNATARKDDVISFLFVKGKHSLVQSDGPGVCTNSTTLTSLSSGIKSEGETYNFTVNQNNGAIYYFCDYGQHCLGGEWGVINVVSGNGGGSGSGSNGGKSSASVNVPNSLNFFLLFTITLFFFKSMI